MLIPRLSKSSAVLGPYGTALRSPPLCAKKLFSRVRNSSSRASTRLDLSEFSWDKIRNFCIVAHVDHGKSSLADRLLEQTGVISTRQRNQQVLDKLKVERERGITIKAQTASMFYTYKGERYLLNLIDTPGHVDFSYEVSRSLAACQGAILLVDSSQGIQAQTVANFYLAYSAELSIVPVLNKIDLPGSDVELVKSQIERTFEISAADCVAVSAKTGQNVDQILPLIINKVPPPMAGKAGDPLKALLFDSWYDTYLGVVALFAVKQGTLTTGDIVLSATTHQKYEVTELGIMQPNQRPCKALNAGQVGYAVLGMKNTSETRIGDTFYHFGRQVEPLPGFRPARSMVFAGIYPLQANEFSKLADALSRLTVNDASVTLQRETSNALGQGFRLGFLGTLHMQVFCERLNEEHQQQVLISSPTVSYRLHWKSSSSQSGAIQTIENPIAFPDYSELNRVFLIEEPVIKATIVAPHNCIGAVVELCNSRRGVQLDMAFPSDQQVILTYELPLSEVLTQFYDALKSRTSGYASLDYEDAGFRTTDLVKLQVLLNGKVVDALTSLVHRSQVQSFAKSLLLKLSKALDRQLFEVIVQCTVEGKVIARQSLKALRKDVTAKLYGGDVTRRMKLLNKQKEGKKKLQLQSIGTVRIKPEKFQQLFSSHTSSS